MVSGHALDCGPSNSDIILLFWAGGDVLDNELSDTKMPLSTHDKALGSGSSHCEIFHCLRPS